MLFRSEVSLKLSKQMSLDGWYVGVFTRGSRLRAYIEPRDSDCVKIPATPYLTFSLTIEGDVTIDRMPVDAAARFLCDALFTAATSGDDCSRTWGNATPAQ